MSDHPLITAIQPILDAVGACVIDADEADISDIPLVWDGTTVAAVRPPPLHGALDRLIDGVETELGAPLTKLSREDKQRAVRLLDQRGAFILRRAVEDVADAMGVSRITVYNYLNAIHR
ncbi:MAG: transcriptional regulator [Ilumatobacter coccineus]|uniref:Transcriptional regulator n=1 Tax=Ilumatobacter coccineus TaxID=467094 RepID=A0A2G6K857_9ACTN|nr:MAG: transcriptional regulator [Ilumatobacter coccineus]